MIKITITLESVSANEEHKNATVAKEGKEVSTKDTVINFLKEKNSSKNAVSKIVKRKGPRNLDSAWRNAQKVTIVNPVTGQKWNTYKTSGGSYMLKRPTWVMDIVDQGGNISDFEI